VGLAWKERAAVVKARKSRQHEPTEGGRTSSLQRPLSELGRRDLVARLVRELAE
jgi:hypothetical protein